MDRESMVSNYSKEVKNKINHAKQEYSKENKSVTFESPDISRKSINLIHTVKCPNRRSTSKRHSIYPKQNMKYSRNKKSNSIESVDRDSEIVENCTGSPSKRIFDLFVNDPYLINLRLRQNLKNRKTPQPNVKFRKTTIHNILQQNNSKGIHSNPSEKWDDQRIKSKSCSKMKQFSESLMNTIKNQNQQLISDLNTHTFERVKYTQIFESPSPQAIEAKAVNFAKVK